MAPAIVSLFEPGVMGGVGGKPRSGAAAIAGTTRALTTPAIVTAWPARFGLAAAKTRRAGRPRTAPRAARKGGPSVPGTSGLRGAAATVPYCRSMVILVVVLSVLAVLALVAAVAVALIRRRRRRSVFDVGRRAARQLRRPAERRRRIGPATDATLDQPNEAAWNAADSLGGGF